MTVLRKIFGITLLYLLRKDDVKHRENLNNIMTYTIIQGDGLESSWITKELGETVLNKEKTYSARKILLIANKGLNNSGIPAVIMSIVRSLHSKFTFDIVVFTNKKGYNEKEFLSYGGKIIRIPFYKSEQSFARKLRYLKKRSAMYKSVKKVICENGPYIAVHCHNFTDSAYCLQAAYECNIPVRIAHFHALAHKNPLILRNTEKRKLQMIQRLATKKIACSESVYSSYFGENEQPLIVINPYNAKFNPNQYSDPKPNDLTITQVGSFSPIKNQLFSLKVLEEIKKVIPNVKLNLVGFEVKGQNYKSQLEQTIKDKDIVQNVEFYPADADTPLLYSKSHLALVPSTEEGFGIVAIEAQAMGVHVFASDALPEITNAGGCTYLPLSLGSKEWAARILQWFSTYDPNAQHYDCSAFSEKEISKQYERIYEGLI